MSSTIDLTIKESQKNKMVKEDGLDKWAALEQRLRAFEGTNLHNHIKAVEMCLWKDLVDAFIRQYKLNIDVGLDRPSLQAMEKDNKESIREYAQRPHTLNTLLEALHKFFLTWLLWPRGLNKPSV
ncbi:hypothetical protein Peur_065671 [Populus x canadensis]